MTIGSSSTARDESSHTQERKVLPEVQDHFSRIAKRRLPSKKERILIKKSSELTFLGIVLLVGMIIRLDLLSAARWSIDSDEAIVGLMAKHILEGKDLPVFYYGQHYMGSLEPLTAALFFALFGMSTLTLRLVPFLYSLLLICTTYLLGKEVAGNRVGKIAALFMALPPIALVEWSTKARGGFIEIVLIGTYALLKTIQWYRKKEPAFFTLFFIGVLLGFGWWTNNQVLYFFAPVGLLGIGKVWTFSKEERKPIKHFFLFLLMGLGGWGLGSLPFWVYNITHDFASFGMFHFADHPKRHLIGFFRDALPIILGGKRFWHEEALFPGSVLLVYIGSAFVLFHYIVKATKAFQENKEQSILLWALIVFPVFSSLIFVGSSYGHLVTAPRYLLPLYPVIYVMAALVLASLPTRLSIVGIGGVVIMHLLSVYLGGRAVPGEPFVYSSDRVQRDHKELISWLNEHHFTWVKTNYWIGYKLAFETKEAIRFVMVYEPFQLRIPQYQSLGFLEPEETLPLVLTPLQAKRVESALSAVRYQFDQARVGGYEIFYNLRKPYDHLQLIPNDEVTAEATHKVEDIHLAIDGDPLTRWGTGAPQRPGMAVDLHLNGPKYLKGVTIDEGKWFTDFPRSLGISCKTDQGEKVLLDPGSVDSARYFYEGAPLTIYFDPPEACSDLKLRQEGNDPRFDWSISEVKLWQ